MDSLKRVGELLYVFDLRSHAKWVILSVAIGIVAGSGAIVFQFLTQVAGHQTLGKYAGYHPKEPAGEHSYFAEEEHEFSPWMIVVVATLGGLASGMIVYTFAPEAEGHGTDAAIEAFHNKRGEIRPRIPFVKTIASAITLGTGGSGGREGPIAQIGAGFGSFLATSLKLSARDRRIMLAAGAGAGVGAIFRAPLAGALFAAEILYSDSEFESDVIVPAAMASIVAYTTYSQSIPGPLRYVPLFGNGLHHQLNSALELIPYTVLAIILAFVAAIYVRVFYGTHNLFHKIPIKPHFRPAIGAMLTALLGVGLFYAFNGDRHVLAVLGTGYGSLQEALASAASLGIPLLLTIAFAKIITTSLTIGSGGSGGVFGPSMVIGGCLGASVGLFFHQIWPQVVTEPGAYGLVGMAGFFAGAAHAPISTIIMVSEMTGDYTLLLPTMLASMLSFLLCRRYKLYEKQLPSRLESPAHRGDFIVDMLEGIKVKDVYRPNVDLVFIPEGMPLEQIVHIMAETQQHYFPVVDDEQNIVGVFSSDDVRFYLYDETLWTLAVARDVMISKIVSVTPEDDLNTALTRFTSVNVDELPVFAPEGKNKLLGMLGRKESISAYNQQLMKHKQAVADP